MKRGVFLSGCRGVGRAGSRRVQQVEKRQEARPQETAGTRLPQQGRVNIREAVVACVQPPPPPPPPHPQYPLAPSSSSNHRDTHTITAALL